MGAIQIRDVSFTYGNGLVLAGVNISVGPGEKVALIGPNGSGKSTLLKLVGGVLRPKGGKVQIDDFDPCRSKRRLVASKVAVVPQQFHMPFAFTVEEVVMLGRTPFLGLLSGSSRQDMEAVRGAIEAAGAGPLGKRYFNELSGGERQKVVLAMALAQQPRLLLLDEPTAHLDITHQAEILELLAELNRRDGTTIIAAIHDLNLAAMHFPRIVLLHQGRVIADGPPSHVLTPDLVARAYRTQVHVMQHPLADVPYVIAMPRYYPHATQPLPDQESSL